MKMLSIDQDNDSSLELMNCFFNLSYAAYQVQFRKSAFLKGFHVKAFVNQKMTREQERMHREVFKDDKIRIDFDFDPDFPMKPKQVLWDHKNGMSAGNWTDEIKHIPIPFKSSKIPFRRRKKCNQVI